MEPENLKEWSATVRARDGRCVRCGSTQKLHAHHIKRKWEFPELKLSLSNGETLCSGCHAKEHESDFPGLVKDAPPTTGGSHAPRKRKSKRISHPIPGRDRIEELERALAVLTKQNLALISELARLKKEIAALEATKSAQ